MVLNYILLENIIRENVVYAIKFYLQFLCVAGYLKHGNDTPHLKKHKHANYNIIEIYINKLSTTALSFIPMDYLIMMSEKYLFFRKRREHLARTFFTHPVEVTGSMYFGNIFRIISLPKLLTNCTQGFITSIFLLLQAAVKLRNSQIHENYQL